MKESKEKNTKKTVLIVDDDSDVLEIITETLKKAQFNIISSADPVEVEKLLNENAFNAVVCDYYMPKKSAQECLKIVKERKGERFPIIFITGRKQEIPNSDDKTIVKGSYNVNEKPVHVKSLVNSLNKELNNFLIFNPKDFVSIELQGICSPLDDSSKKYPLSIVEFSEGQSLIVEMSQLSVEEGVKYHFHINCDAVHSSLNFEFDGVVNGISKSDDEEKILVSVLPTKLEPALMGQLQGIFTERQEDITDFFKKAKGLLL